MKCVICDIIKSKKDVIYEDDVVFGYLSDTPSIDGHIVLAPKEHNPILEMVSQETLNHLFSVANKLSIILFESMKAKGTNIIVKNGISAGQFHPHFSVNIIPRFENDGINFQWTPKKYGEKELSTIEMKYKEVTNDLFAPPKKVTKPIQGPTEVQKQEEHEDYLLKHLKRIP